MPSSVFTVAGSCGEELLIWVSTSEICLSHTSRLGSACACTLGICTKLPPSKMQITAIFLTVISAPHGAHKPRRIICAEAAPIQSYLTLKSWLSGLSARSARRSPRSPSTRSGSSRIAISAARAGCRPCRCGSARRGLRRPRAGTPCTRRERGSRSVPSSGRWAGRHSSRGRTPMRAKNALISGGASWPSSTHGLRRVFVGAAFTSLDLVVRG